MSTGAPLNLPKPKATTNTGQDMIELGNSLQKINDAIKEIRSNLYHLKVEQVHSSILLSANTSYLLIVQRLSTSAGFAAQYSIRTDTSGMHIVPFNDSTQVTVTGSGLMLAVDSAVSIRSTLIRLQVG